MKLLVPVISAEDVVKCSTLSKNVAYYMGISLAEWNKRFGMHDDFIKIIQLFAAIAPSINCYIHIILTRRITNMLHNIESIRICSRTKF